MSAHDERVSGNSHANEWHRLYWRCIRAQWVDRLVLAALVTATIVAALVLSVWVSLGGDEWNLRSLASPRGSVPSMER